MSGVQQDRAESQRPGATDTAASAEAVDELARRTQALRAEALEKLGVVGDADTGRLRDLMREHHMRLYPLGALGLLSIIDLFFGFAQSVLTPEMSRSLGLSVGAIAVAFAIQGLATAVAPMPMAALSQRKARRAMLCLVTAFAWSILTLYSAFITSLAGLIFVLVANGLTSGSVSALHTPLLMDSYHPETRVRVMSAYSALGAAGGIAAPLLVVLLTGVFDLTWRGVFLVLGILSTVATLFALRLRDPGFGAWDTQQIRQTVHEHDGTADGSTRPGQTPIPPVAQDASLGFWEICRRLLLIPTIKRLLSGYLVFGILTIPLATFFVFFLDQRWDLDPAQRSFFYAYQSVVSIVVLVLYGNRGEKFFRQDPAKVVRAAGALLGLAIVVLMAGALAPVFWGVVVCFGISTALVSALGPALAVGIMSITPANMRPHLGALAGIFAAVGGIAGALFLGGVDARFGIVGAMVSLAVPGVLGSLVIASAGKFIGADLERMVDEILEDETIKEIKARGERLPMLAVHGVDFSYGQVQVLFGVDFTVDDGELVALLGVNGAGKSTLLKVISGIGLPSKGTVRLRGQDITYLDAERRVALGIAQVPGGRAVFGSLTLEENLRVFGHTVGHDRRRLERAIDECFSQFPQLAARRSQQASTLSGGEQQMLALSKAFILRPQLLVIDELSLGLAPVVVGQLLETVRRINAMGTTVILVEQSVNVALSVAHHAYFMEKGEMRFDGSSADLLSRDDLLRAVFLKGAAAHGDTPS